MTDVLVIGAGPAGVLAALRAVDLGAQTALVTSGAFAGMAVDDGPVPVRILAHAGRLMRVDDLARIPLSYPAYVGILVRVPVKAAHKLGPAICWQAHQAA